jgi:hypothetical protein
MLAGRVFKRMLLRLPEFFRRAALKSSGLGHIGLRYPCGFEMITM